jgi:predicted O-methyltransferase YrrM
LSAEATVKNSRLPVYVLEKLTHASLADVGRWLANCRNIPAQLAAIRKPTAVEMVVSLLPEVARTEAEACRLEFLKDYAFLNAVDEKMVERRGHHLNWTDWHEFLYMAVRFSRPRVFFETGVFDGQSSAIILRAMTKNDVGELVSIDLPAYEAIEGSTNLMLNSALPSGCQPGWAVPDSLRERYHLTFGDSKELLPALLRQYAKIDVFFHDSLHTFEHMYFEYTAAWPFLLDGGLMLSDDVSYNPAFHKFCKQKGKRYFKLGAFGAVRK